MLRRLLPATFAFLPLLLVAGSALLQAQVTVGAQRPLMPMDSLSAMMNRAFSRASALVSPMVVSVTTPLRKKDDQRLGYLNEYLRQFGEGLNTERYRSKSIGSGVFVTENGYLLTNHHVIEDSYDDSILITLYDGSTYFADIVGTDARTDLAVLRVYGRGFIVPHFGSDEGLRTGEWVLAVGNPLGLRSTVTTGIISAFGRGESGWEADEYAIQDYIQTDAAINPGNSGGGLFDLQGNLVGINTAIYTSSGLYQGYGFAIPYDLARVVAEDLIEDGEIDRGYLGIAADDLTGALAAELGVSAKTGVVIDQVDAGSPAAAGGLQRRDVVRTVNGAEVVNVRDMQSALAFYRVGDELTLGVTRGGAETEIKVALGAAPEERGKAGETKRGVRPRSKPSVGIATSSKGSGLVVESVRPHGTASHAGIVRGDVILRVGDRSVTSQTDLDSAIAGMSPGDLVKLAYSRNGAETEIEVVLQPAR